MTVILNGVDGGYMEKDCEDVVASWIGKLWKMVLWLIGAKKSRESRIE